MPTSLRTLVSTKNDTIVGPSENDLEQGKIWVYTPATSVTPNIFRWCPPGGQAGTVVIEMWGGGGGGSRMCCCGFGMPGNAGAYVKKSFTITAAESCSAFVCGCIEAHSATRNPAALCDSGCGPRAFGCWFRSSTTGNNGCLCAQGGRSGISFCSTGSSAWCCYLAAGYCGTGPVNANCGLICNITSTLQIACGYGGDVNCCGHFSCIRWFGCNANAACCTTAYIPGPSGIISEKGVVLEVFHEYTNEFSDYSGTGRHQQMYMQNAVSRKPAGGIPFVSCWNSNRGCGCYEQWGCTSMSPPGFGGHNAVFEAGVRDNGMQGGNAAVKIKFIAS
jgi:hypothetical protein